MINLSNTKHLKKTDEGLMPEAWHPRRWSDWSERSEKRSKTNFYCKNWEKLKVNEMLLVHVGTIPRHRKLV